MIKIPRGCGIKRPKPKLDCSLTEEEDDDVCVCVS